MSSSDARPVEARAALPLPVIDLGPLLNIPRHPTGSSPEEIRAHYKEWLDHRKAESERLYGVAEEEVSGDENDGSREELAESNAAARPEERAAAPASVEQANESRSACGHREGDVAVSAESRNRPVEGSPNDEENAKRPAKEADTNAPSNDNVHTAGAATSENRCVPLLPVPVMCLSTQEEAETVSLPLFQELVNYPNYIGQRISETGTKCCIMCGQECPWLASKRDKKDARRLLVPQGRSICTVCRDVVWKVVVSGVAFKWCGPCKKLLPWTLFRGDQGMVKTCKKCRCKQSEYIKMRSERNKGAATTGDIERRCVPLTTIPLEAQSSTLLHDESLPSFRQLVNFPHLVGQHPKDGARICVMCCVAARFVKSQKECKGDATRFIRQRDKGVCSACRQISWVVVETNLQIKWCSRCKNFCVKAAFNSGRGGQAPRLEKKRKSMSAEKAGDPAASTEEARASKRVVISGRKTTDQLEGVPGDIGEGQKNEQGTGHNFSRKGRAVSWMPRTMHEENSTL